MNTRWSSLYDEQRGSLPILQTVEEAVAWTNELVEKLNHV